MIYTLDSLLLQKISESLRAAGLLPELDEQGRITAPPPVSGPAFIFGGGQHTWWLSRCVPDFRFGRVNVACVIDDQPQGMAGQWPCLRALDAVRQFGRPGAVILSTDMHQVRFASRVREIFGDQVPAIDLYTGLPGGPYHKEVEQRHQHGNFLSAHTALCLERTGAAMNAYLHRHNLRRVFLVGQNWQKQATARGFQGIDVVSDPAQADAAVVCAEEIEIPGQSTSNLLPPGLQGPVLNLKSGARPWINRTPGNDPRPGLSTDRVRIAIRHDELLGDVLLSQGILPERLKRELYPNAHITFITARSASSRPGSESTGWAVDAIRHNPWVDEVIDCERFVEGTCWWAGYDRAYRIITNGGIYDHVFDVQAMHVELPPGRTDAKLYLCDQDRALAEAVVGVVAEQTGKTHRAGPVIAVNMSLTASRLRGWGDAKTAELCSRLEKELEANIVWMGWTEFGPYKRLVDPRPGQNRRALSVREQAAVMQRCDLHITCQGGGANMSAAVGCQTLALSGLHAPWREGVAYFNNQYIADPSRWHVEVSRYDDGAGEKLRVLNYSKTRDVPWRLDHTLPPHRREHENEITQYEKDIWSPTTLPAESFPRSKRHLWRTWDLTVDEVFSVAAEMIKARRTGSPVPGE